MQVHTAKQDAISAIERIPHDVTLDEIVYPLNVQTNSSTTSRRSTPRRRSEAQKLLQEIEAW